ncbi:hypothetical protein Tco_0670064 [Tanacetum coccineum]
MQTQENHSNLILALKVDLVVIQNTFSEKEDNNSETASIKLVKECSLNFETKDVHAIKYKMSTEKERCIAYFRSLHSHLQVLSKDDLKGTCIEHGFKRAFMSLFGQDVDTFIRTMLLNVDQLQKQLDKDEFQEDGSMTAFWVKSVAERTRHQRQYERRANKRQMQMQESKIDTGKALDADLVDTESIRTESTVQDDSNMSGNDTDADDADIRPIYDEEPMAEIALAHLGNSSKNMPRFSSNDMVHNHYLDIAKKKIQERDRNSTTSVTTSARFQSTTDDSKPKPRSNNQTSRSLPVSKSSRVTITVVPKADHSKSSSSFSDSKHFVCSTCHKCVFNANHDACITKFLKEVNSRAKIQSHKTRNSNKPVDQKEFILRTPGRRSLQDIWFFS